MQHCDSVRRDLADFEFPFLALHDPNDAVVSFEGTTMLMARARSPVKTLIEIEAGGHDMYCNVPGLLVEHIAHWANQQSGDRDQAER